MSKQSNNIASLDFDIFKDNNHNVLSRRRHYASGYEKKTNTISKP